MFVIFFMSFSSDVGVSTFAYPSKYCAVLRRCEHKLLKVWAICVDGCRASPRRSISNGRCWAATTQTLHRLDGVKYDYNDEGRL